MQKNKYVQAEHDLITKLTEGEESAKKEGWIEADDLEKEMINRIDDAIYESE